MDLCHVRASLRDERLSCQASLKQNLSFPKNETELVSFCRALKADIFILCYHTHTSSYIASLLHHHTMHHICMDILVYAVEPVFKPSYIIQNFK